MDEAYFGARIRISTAISGEAGLSNDKTPVIGAILGSTPRRRLKDSVVCQMIEHADTKTLNRFVRKAISDQGRLISSPPMMARPSLFERTRLSARQRNPLRWRVRPHEGFFPRTSIPSGTRSSAE